VSPKVPLYGLLAAGVLFGAVQGIVIPGTPPDHVLYLGRAFTLLFLTYCWFYYDRRERGYEAGAWLRIGFIALMIVVLPVYLFRSRGARGGSVALLKTFGLLLLWTICQTCGIALTTAFTGDSLAQHIPALAGH